MCERLGLDPGCLIVGMIGRLDRQKNPEDFIRAAAAVAREHPHVQFVIAGEGSLRRACEDLIDSLGLVENAASTGAYLLKSMNEALSAHAHVGDVRGEGMLCAVEFVEDKDERRFFDPARKVGPQIAAALLKEGVIGRAMPQGDILGFAPPLCLTREEADAIVTATKKAVKAVLD